jgi:hypothetical protein
MTPDELAGELGISGQALRGWLRSHFGRPPAQKGSTWSLSDEQIEVVRAWRAGGSRHTRRSHARRGRPRAESDAAYVLDLCDELLEERGSREHSFEWLLGDPGKNGTRRKLPVDAYYPGHRLVIEYRERQHDEPNTHFDKPAVMTVSGVHRGEQRRRYDERRDREIPANGLRLLVIKPDDLDATRRGRLRRVPEHDRHALGVMLLRWRRALATANPAE